MQAPILVLNTNTKRESGRKVQLGNIMAAKSVADIIRTTLGPRAMLKMILDPMGGIVMTNDGNAILREIDVTHPAAKSMIELARTQDEEVGDGTTSVIILAGEMLNLAQPLLQRNMHPRVIVGGYMKALDDILAMLAKLTVNVDTKDKNQILTIVKACLGTKFVSRFGDQIAQMAVDAVTKIVVELDNKKKEIDIKRFARIEKLPGGFLEESKVLDGLMFNKDVVLPGNMKRQITKPRVVLLDMGLEYKKGESQTAIELTKDSDFEKVLQAEEKAIQDMCNNIIRVKPTLVFTEKGCSDLAGHFLAKAGITVIRRVKKTDNDRIARVTGATIVNDPAELTDKDVGTHCGNFEVKKLGDEYFTFLTECKDPKACTIILRGASKDVLNEIERNLHDAMAVVRNIILDPRVLPGGGAVEMALEHMLLEKAKTLDGVQQFPYKAVAQALEVIPRTLVENCGGSTIRLMTDLRGRHAEAKNTNLGIDGNKGVIADMSDLKVFDTFSVKAQTYKTALESAAMLLRIDDIVSGMNKAPKQGGGGGHADHDHDQDTFGDQRDG